MVSHALSHGTTALYKVKRVQKRLKWADAQAQLEFIVYKSTSQQVYK